MHFETTFAGNIFFHLSTHQAKYRLYLLNDKRLKKQMLFHTGAYPAKRLRGNLQE